MSLDTMHTRNGRFFYNENSEGWSPSELGKAIIEALLRNRSYSDFGIDADAAVEVIRVTGRTGKFFMNLSCDEFPVTNSMRLREAAASLERQAHDLFPLNVEEVRAELFLLAFHMRCKAASEDVAGAKSCSSKHGITLPKVKCADAKIGTNAIWWNATTRTFNFGGYQLGSNKLGRLLALTLMRGEEWIEIADIRVTVDYVVEMCRIVGAYGRFSDFVDEHFEPLCPRLSRQPAPVDRNVD